MRNAVCFVVVVLFSVGVAAQTKSAPQKAHQGAGKAAPADAAVKQAIDTANKKFLDEMQKGDAEAATANYADDAVVMMPNEPAWKGRAAILAGMKGFVSNMAIKDGATHTSDVIVAGNIAVETGTFEWTLQPKGGTPVKDKGKYLTTWRRQADGTWKIIRDINNSDLPAK